MRSVFIALLLAGVATPALAQDGRVHDRFGRHGQDSNQQGDSSQSDAKPQRPQRNAEPRRETMPASEPNEVRSGMGRQHSYSGAGAAVEQGAMRSASGQARRSQQVPPAVQQVEEHHNVEAKVIHAPQGRSGDVGEHRTGAGRFHTPGEQATTSHSNIEERNLRRAPGTREQQGDPRDGAPGTAYGDVTSGSPDAAVDHPLAQRPSLRLAELAAAPPLQLPPWLLLRPVRLGLHALRGRMAPVA